MSDRGQGLPQDPPGMLLSSHLSKRKPRVVGERPETQGDAQHSGLVGIFSPSARQPRKAKRPRVLMGGGHLIKISSRSPQQGQGNPGDSLRGGGGGEHVLQG